jgi:ABC-2 type transport system ATP-binding protein
MLTAERLSKKFGSVIACDAVSFTLDSGEIAALAGVNGAGKSTLIKMLAGVLKPDCGAVAVCGHDMSAVEARRSVGSMFEDAPLWGEMTVRSHLALSASAYGLSRSDARNAVDRALAECDLSDAPNAPVDRLPKGIRQRLSLALAIAHEPRVLVLDEPTAGLDPVQLSRFRTLMLTLRGRGTSILMSTHVMQEAESLCDRVIVIDSGSLKADLPVESFRDLSRSRSLEDSFISLISRPAEASR